MVDPFDAIVDVANRTGRPVSELLRHHLLEAVLRRTPPREEPEFVLRGSMITRLWAIPFPRSANDLDFLGTFPRSVDGTAERFFPPLAADEGDGVRFHVNRCFAGGIWESSEFPGVRLTLRANVLGEEHVATIDVGFRDPLVPPAEVVAYSFMLGDQKDVWAVHPATSIGWKLHGLAEWGRIRWRPKDLLDLWLLTGRFTECPAILSDALRVAFESRGYPSSSARQTLEDSGWETFAARARWNHFRAEQPDVPIPESILDVRKEVLTRLKPALDLLPK